MKKHLFKTLLITATLLLAACHRNDTRTETFYLEQFRSDEAIPYLENALRPLPGIQAVSTKRDARTLTIVFDGRAIFLKNIEFELVNAGFSLPNWPATEKQKSKLPESLR